MDQIAAFWKCVGSLTKRHAARQAMSDLLGGRAGLSAEMAIRFEKAFGLSADTLMRMQAGYELAVVRARAGEIAVERVAA